MKRTITRQRITRAAATLAAPRRALVLALTLIAALTVQTAWADSYPAYITDVMVIGGDASTVDSKWATYQSQGYVKVDFDLNSGAGGDYVYVLYKTGSRNSTDGGYVTDLVVSTTDASSVTYNGTTYTRVAHDGSDHFKTYGGNLNSSAKKSGSTNMWLFYTKKNFSDKRAVNDIVVNTSSSKSGYTTIGKNGGSDAYDLNDGAGGDYVYMHFSTTTKTNRPASDPTMKTGLVYTGQPLQLVSYNPTSQCTMYYRVGTSGSYTSTVSDITATNAGTHAVYYYAATNSYGDYGPTFSQTVTISKAANSGVTVSCDDVMEGNAPQPTLGGTNLSTGAVTYRYSTSQSGSYTTTVPTTAGTYWVKVTIASDANCNEYTTAAASFTMTPDWELHNSGSSEADAYVINTTADLDLLAQRVNAGNNYSGKYFRLGADITYDGTENNYNRIGLQDKPFSGHFDGKGHSISGININKTGVLYLGLFGHIDSGASVKNIRLSNVIIVGKSYCGGIAGMNSGGVVENCSVASDVRITANNSYSERIGGIVGHNNGTVSGCKSSATINAYEYGNGNQYLGGIVGRNDGTLRNNVVAEAQITGSYKFSGIICYYYGTLTCNYYLDSSGSDKEGARRGVRINAADGVTVTPTGTATTYDVSGITAYDGNSGILYGGTLYAGATEQVRLNISYAMPADYQFNGYTDGHGNALTANGNGTYTLTMTAEAATVTPEGTSLWGIADGADGSQQHPYVITTTAGLDLLAQKVNSGTNYSGQYFELGADIAYDKTVENNYTPIGNKSKTFKGHFDGKGHTVSGINVNLPSTDYVGLFASVSYATIQNLTLANSTICGGNYVGDIVGSGGSTNTTIENCHVESDVTVSGTYYVGGIVGIYATVRGCTGAATVSATASDSYAGGIISFSDNSTIENCLVYGGTINGTNAGAIAGTSTSDGTLTNNHYTGVTLNGSEAGLNAGVGGDGSQDGTSYICAIIPYKGVTLSIPSVSATTEYPYNGLKIYSTGMSYKGQYYNYYYNADAGISGDVTFTATYTGSVPEDYALSGFGSTSSADDTDVPMKWAATDGSATCTLNTYLKMNYYIAPTFRYAIWGDGDGTQGNPYIITTVSGMNELASRVNSGEDLGGKYFELGADITYDGTENNYTAIGTNDHHFSANFDGKGHTISGININTGSNCQGIFGYAANCTIQDLTLANSTITNGGYSGGIFGRGEGVTVSNCHVANTVTMHANGTMFGGIGGFAMYNSTIQGCTSAATLSFKWNYNNGGIMGGMNGGTLKDCLYLGPKFDTDSNGAILGCITQNDPTITNSYHTAYGMKATRHSDAYNTNFAVATTDKPEGASETATATYGSGSYTGITVFGNVLYYDGKYYWHDENLMELADRNENNSIIADNHEQTRNVVLKDRTLLKNGDWNTLCLPFSLTAEQIAASPLAGATIKELLSTSNLNSEGKLTLNFQNVTAIMAGKPYMVKWDPTDNLTNPVFNNVTIDNTVNDVSFTGGSFKGTYAPLEITDANRNEVLLLATGNRLGYAKTDRTVANGKALGTCRAYFEIPTTTGAPAINSYELNFGEGTATSISEELRVKSEEFATATGWYTLDGRRLQDKPAQKGVYIQNGKKVIIK